MELTLNNNRLPQDCNLRTFNVVHSNSEFKVNDKITYQSIKVNSVFSRYFKLMLSILLLFPVIKQIIQLVCYVNDMGKTKINKECLLSIKKRQVQEIKTVYANFADKLKSSPSIQDENLNKLISQFIKKLELQPTAREVQTFLKKIYENTSYQELKKTGHPFAVFLETLATTLRTSVVGGDILRDYGKFVLEKQTNQFSHKNCYSLVEIGNIAVDAFNERPFEHFDHPFEMAFHALKDFKVVLNMMKNPVAHYNPYDCDNFNISTGNYLFNGNDEGVRFFHGPTPGITSDRMLSLHLDHCKSKGSYHLQHSMEYACWARESARLKQLKKFEDGSEGHMRLFVTPVDGPAWHGKKEFEQWDNAQELLEKYKNLAVYGSAKNDPSVSTKTAKKAYRDLFNHDKLGESSFYIGDSVMSDDQFESIFDIASKIFSDEELKNNPYWQQMMTKGNEGKILLSKGLQVFVQAATSLGALAKLSNDANGNLATFGQACMEDVDRGAVLNIATRLLTKVISEEEISLNELYDLFGGLFGRAEITSDRRIMQDRFEGLVAFLFLLGSHPKEKLNILKSYFDETFFKGGKMEPAFIPNDQMDKITSCYSTGVISD